MQSSRNSYKPERSHHGSSHLGRMSIDHLLPAVPFFSRVTRADLETLATVVLAKLDLAIYHRCPVQEREYMAQLVKLAEYADTMGV
jgi:hypothetical protein